MNIRLLGLADCAAALCCLALVFWMHPLSGLLLGGLGWVVLKWVGRHTPSGAGGERLARGELP